MNKDKEYFFDNYTSSWTDIEGNFQKKVVLPSDDSTEKEYTSLLENQEEYQKAHEGIKLLEEKGIDPLPYINQKGYFSGKDAEQINNYFRAKEISEENQRIFQENLRKEQTKNDILSRMDPELIARYENKIKEYQELGYTDDYIESSIEYQTLEDIKGLKSSLTPTPTKPYDVFIDINSPIVEYIKENDEDAPQELVDFNFNALGETNLISKENKDRTFRAFEIEYKMFLQEAENNGVKLTEPERRAKRQELKKKYLVTAINTENIDKQLEETFEKTNPGLKDITKSLTYHSQKTFENLFFKNWFSDTFYNILYSLSDSFTDDFGVTAKGENIITDQFSDKSKEAREQIRDLQRERVNIISDAIKVHDKFLTQEEERILAFMEEENMSESSNIGDLVSSYEDFKEQEKTIAALNSIREQKRLNERVLRGGSFDFSWEELFKNVLMVEAAEDIRDAILINSISDKDEKDYTEADKIFLQSQGFKSLGEELGIQYVGGELFQATRSIGESLLFVADMAVGTKMKGVASAGIKGALRSRKLFTLGKYGKKVSDVAITPLFMTSFYKGLAEEYRPDVYVDLDKEGNIEYITQENAYKRYKTEGEELIKQIDNELERRQTISTGEGYSTLELNPFSELSDEELKSYKKATKQYLQSLKPTSLLTSAGKSFIQTGAEILTERTVGPLFDKYFSISKAIPRMGAYTPKYRNPYRNRVVDYLARTGYNMSQYAKKRTGLDFDYFNSIGGETLEEVANVFIDVSPFLGQDLDLGWDEYTENMKQLGDFNFYKSVALSTVGQNTIMRGLSTTSRIGRHYANKHKVKELTDRLQKAVDSDELSDLTLLFLDDSRNRDTGVLSQKVAILKNDLEELVKTNQNQQNSQKIIETKQKLHEATEELLYKTASNLTETWNAGAMIDNLTRSINQLEKKNKEEQNPTTKKNNDFKIEYLKNVREKFDAIKRGTRFEHGRKNILYNVQAQIHNDYTLKSTAHTIRELKERTGLTTWGEVLDKFFEKTEDGTKYIILKDSQNGDVIISENEFNQDAVEIAKRLNERLPKDQQFSNAVFSLQLFQNKENVIKQNQEILKKEYKEMVSIKGQKRFEEIENIKNNFFKDFGNLMKQFDGDLDKIEQSKEYKELIEEHQKRISKAEPILGKEIAKHLNSKAVIFLSENREIKKLRDKAKEAQEKLQDLTREKIDELLNTKKENINNLEALTTHIQALKYAIKELKQRDESVQNTEDISFLEADLKSYEQTLQEFLDELNKKDDEEVPEREEDAIKEEAKEIIKNVQDDVEEKEEIEKNLKEEREKSTELTPDAITKSVESFKNKEENTEKTRQELLSVVPEEYALALKGYGKALEMYQIDLKEIKDSLPEDATIQDFVVAVENLIKQLNKPKYGLRELYSDPYNSIQYTDNEKFIMKQVMEQTETTFEEFIEEIYDSFEDKYKKTFYRHLKQLKYLWNEVHPDKKEESTVSQILSSLMRKNKNIRKSSIRGVISSASSRVLSTESTNLNEENANQVNTVEQTEDIKNTNSKTQRIIILLKNVFSHEKDVIFSSQDFDENGELIPGTISYVYYEAYKKIKELEENKVSSDSEEVNKVPKNIRLPRIINGFRSVKAAFSFYNTKKTIKNGKVFYDDKTRTVSDSSLINLKAMLKPSLLKIGAIYRTQVLTNEKDWGKYKIEIRSGYEPSNETMFFDEWVEMRVKQLQKENPSMTKELFMQTQEFKDNVPIVYNNQRENVAFVLSPTYYNKETMPNATEEEMEEARKELRIYRENIITDKTKQVRLTEYIPSPTTIKNPEGPQTLEEALPRLYEQSANPQSKDYKSVIYVSTGESTHATTMKSSREKFPENYIVSNLKNIVGKQNEGKMFILIPTHSTQEGKTYARAVLINTLGKKNKRGLYERDSNTLQNYLELFASSVYQTSKKSFDDLYEEMKDSYDENKVKQKFKNNFDSREAFYIFYHMKKAGKKVMSLDETIELNRELGKFKVPFPQSITQVQEFMQKYAYVGRLKNKQGLFLRNYINALYGLEGLTPESLKYNLRTIFSNRQGASGIISIERTPEGSKVNKIADNSEMFIMQIATVDQEYHDLSTDEEIFYTAEVQPTIFMTDVNASSNVIEVSNEERKIIENFNKAKQTVEVITEDKKTPKEEIVDKKQKEARGEKKEKPLFVYIEKDLYSESGEIPKNTTVTEKDRKVGKNEVKIRLNSTQAKNTKIDSLDKKIKTTIEIPLNEVEAIEKREKGFTFVTPVQSEVKNMTEEEIKEYDNFIENSPLIKYVEIAKDGELKEC